MSIQPSIIFIVPYRDRKQHQEIFSNHMKNILSDYKKEDYQIIYVHQMDDRNFNRGAMKNIGYIYVKDTYPENYRDITLVFNDVDTMPKKQNALDYKTVKGNIKHFYGFEFTLGGIVSITAGDFEDLGGFPNFWCWGFEDNYLQKKAKTNKINIDRTTFYDIGSKEIIHLKDDIEKPVNKIEHEIFKKGVNEGFKNITDLDYYFIDTTGFLNVKHFNTDRKENPNYTKMHNVTQSRVPFNKRGALMNMKFT